VVLKVPRVEVDEALDLINAIRFPPEEKKAEPKVASSVGPYRSAGDKADAMPRKLRRVAAFCACAMTFGTGHFYAGELGAGWVLLGAQIVAMTIGFRETATRGALVGVVLLIAFDFVDGIAAVGRVVRGRERPLATQLLTTLPIVAMLVAAPTLATAYY